MLKRSPSLVEQVKLHLKQRIFNDEFDSGRIPSEADLAGELSVSRNTVRDALSRLEVEGVIYRKQGAGTFVNTAMSSLVKTRLEEILPYETLIKEHGYSPAIKVIDVKEQSSDSKIGQLLNLKPDDKLLVVQKLFKADDNPVIFTETYIPKSLITQSYTVNDLQLPIFEFLPEFCHQTLGYYLTDIVPLIPPRWLTKQLHLQTEPEIALLSFEELGYNQNNKLMIKAISYFRDDLLRLRVMRRRT